MTTTTKTNPTAGLVDYGEWTPEAAAAEEAQLAGGGAEWMKLVPGRNVVRIVPPPPGQSPFLIFSQHFVTRPDGTKFSFACPNREKKERCPVCEHANKLFASNNKVDKESAKAFWPRKRILVNVIDRAQPDAGPKVLGIPKTVHEAIIKIRNNPDAGGNPVHPIDGFDLCIERKGSGQLDTEYSVIPSRKNSPLGPTVEVMNGWIAAQHSLTPFAKTLSAAEINAAFHKLDDVQAPKALPAGNKSTANTVDLNDATIGMNGDDDLNF